MAAGGGAGRPGKPMLYGGPGSPGLSGGPDSAGGVDLGVGGLAVLSSELVTVFLGAGGGGGGGAGAGVEEAELVPLWGLTASFLRPPRSSPPFSFGGLRLCPFMPF